MQIQNEAAKNLCDPNKSISSKLSNEIANYLYTEANMSSGASSSNANPAPAASKVQGNDQQQKLNHQIKNMKNTSQICEYNNTHVG